MDSIPASSHVLYSLDPSTGEVEETDLHTYIAELRKENEESLERGDLFSRECPICDSLHPLHRSVCIQCGYAVCRECADGVNECPDCNHPSDFKPLFENDDLSRECPICFDPSPFSRSVFNGCGHVACTACACQITFDRTSRTDCPFCRIDSTELIELEEKVIENLDHLPDIL